MRYDDAENRVVLSWYGSNDDVVRLLSSDDQTVAIERVCCYGLAVGATTLRTAEAVGRFWQRAADLRCEVKLPTRPEICRMLCGLNAKKPQVRARLIELHGGVGAVGVKKKPGPLYGVTSHCWDALAAACWVQP